MQHPLRNHPVVKSLLTTVLTAAAAEIIHKVIAKPAIPKTFGARVRTWGSGKLGRSPETHQQRVSPSTLKHEIRRTLVSIARDLQ